MAKRVPKSSVGMTMNGRVLSFDSKLGYGFIRTKDGEDIFLSSYEISKHNWSSIRVGDYVEFKVGLYSDRVVAQNVTIIKKMPMGLYVILPNEEKLLTRYIRQFGKRSLLDEGYGRIYPGYHSKSFVYVFIKTSKKTYAFNDINSPVMIDEFVNVDEFYEYLTDLLVKYDIERDYDSLTGKALGV